MANILPDIYFFNPTCEYAVANGNASWQPNRILQKMESDLAFLPLFLAKPKDIILVSELPGNRYQNLLKELKLEIPEFTDLSNISSNEKLIKSPKDRLLPWGWSPATHKKLESLKNSCSPEFKDSPVFNWQPHHRNIYSKKFAQGILESILSNYPSMHYISNDQISEVCVVKSDFEVLLKKWGKLMVKAPWSSSGRGLQPIRKKPVHPKVWDKLLGIVKEQEYAIVEPYLNKELDLAFQFELTQGKVTFLGISNFSTDYKGQYNGNSLNGLPDTLSSEVSEFANFVQELIINPIIKTIENSDLAKYYEGYFGVDTLIFRDKHGKLKINPCLEINVRQNMGLLSLQLEKLIHPEKKGIFRTFYKPGKSFCEYVNEMSVKYPLKISNYKIESGFFPLVDANENTLFGAFLLV